MEALEKLKRFWNNKRVLITGHTGFKGSWLALWLVHYGADVVGVSIEPPSKINLYEKLKIKEKIKDYRINILQNKKLEEIFQLHKPEIVFHLAAQSLVLNSYEDPKKTYDTNVIGTLNILEAIRKTNSVKSAILVTSDKCYENVDNKRLKENDRLGGIDIYSSSKGATEILINSYKETFFNFSKYPQISSVRAGNVIGGGDWAKNRIVPDIYWSFKNKKQLILRNPRSIRPWQHVLDPLFGYLLLAKKMYVTKGVYNEAWNFGPKTKNNKNVRDLVHEFGKYWNISKLNISSKRNKIKEENSLMLSSLKAKKRIGWRSMLNFNESVKLTAKWYLKEINNKNMYTESIKQIEFFERIIKNEN